MKSRAMLAAAAAVFGLTAAADDLAGAWLISMQGEQGTNTGTLTVTKGEQGYTGTIEGRRGTTQIESIDVDGGKFSFDVTMATRMGDFDLTYKGAIDGDAMTGAIVTPIGERPFTGKRQEASAQAPEPDSE